MSITSVRNVEHILEAIDQLRRRKARPDINRICNYLFRRFATNSIEARSDLQWCVDNNIVLKVEYKGSTSYRNAAKKFSHPKQVSSDYNGTNRKVNRKFTQLLTNAFGELIVQEPDYLELGVPVKDIISKILSKDSVRYKKKYINILLEKELDSGGLIKMENGNYQLGPFNGEGRYTNQIKSDDNNLSFLSLSNTETDKSSVKNITTIQLKHNKKSEPKPSYHYIDSDDEMKSDYENLSRVGGRRKRAKKVFDPSDNIVPKKRGRSANFVHKSTMDKQFFSTLKNSETPPDSRSSSSNRDQGRVCSVCRLQNKKRPSDKMISCRECNNKAHETCLNGEDMMLKMYPDNTWQCPHCKTCVICYETSNASKLNVCSVCADGYHSTCHQPIVSEKNKNRSNWLCINCQMPEELEVQNIEPSIINSRKLNNNVSSRIASGNSSPLEYQFSVSPPLHSKISSSLTETNKQMSPSSTLSDSQSKDYDVLNENIDPTIPDATHWTYDEVYEYFAQFFPEEAHVFRDQEIDGRSLLLLKRIDVLTNLKLKLGPALKIYKNLLNYKLDVMIQNYITYKKSYYILVYTFY